MVTKAPSSSAAPAPVTQVNTAPEKDSSDDFELPKKKKKKRPVNGPC